MDIQPAFLPMPRIGNQTENTDVEILIGKNTLDITAFVESIHGKSMSGSVFSVWCVARGATEEPLQ
ncbi:MAG: hypothetical protein K2N35_06210 [Muribaculaceae bacterium]|nr:hypothetical protein [Muribaculaceae bacterium]